MSQSRREFPRRAVTVGDRGPRFGAGASQARTEMPGRCEP